jgi:hypothetical protein
MLAFRNSSTMTKTVRVESALRLSRRCGCMTSEASLLH